MYKVIEAITEPRRRDILHLIRAEEMTSSAIASHFEISAPAISQHLMILEEAGLVVVRRAGTKRYCGIRRKWLGDVANHDPF